MEGPFRLDSGNASAFLRGCAILGAGATLGRLEALGVRELERRPVRVVDLEELDCAEPVLVVGTTSDAAAAAFDGGEASQLERALAGGDPRAAAVMAAAIGGPGGVFAAVCASRLGLPLADADAAGRGLPPRARSPLDLPLPAAGRYALVDDAGNVVVVEQPPDESNGSLARRVAVAVGRPCAISSAVEAGLARELALAGTVSWALALGRAGSARGVCELLGGAVLAEGVVVEVRRDGREAIVFDRVAGRTVRVESDGQPVAVFARGRATASVPDLIVVADPVTGSPAAPDALRSGDQVTVLAAPAGPLWTSEEGLAAAGPRTLGLDLDYRPVSACAEARPARCEGGRLLVGARRGGTHGSPTSPLLLR